MQPMFARISCLALMGVMVWTLSGCHKSEAINSPHNLATAAAVQGIGVNVPPERSIECFQKALQLEPDSREWKSMLAFSYYQAKRNSEAIPIWQELAKGNDDKAEQAKKWLAKVGPKP